MNVIASTLLASMRPASFMLRAELAAAVRVAHPKATELQIDRAFAALTRSGLAVASPGALSFCR